MLRLDSLELTGFKSFAEKTRVDFPEGITGIIGPNGCGKSNLSDAIGWVLGLQNARNLRGQRMEDVIFNGTDRRRPSGLVEVKLRLKRLDETPLVWDGVELQEEILEISRKLYRSGEGHSRINDRRCRLKDIHQLLEDAGLGFTSYAMIAQGKIESFLTSRPLDRRAIIEEAAQITGYKNKRRNAELKLEMAQQNLLRINDIILEVERQLRSLKRQAHKARRYRKVKDEFQDLQGQRFAVEALTLNQELSKLNQDLKQLRAEELELKEGLDREESSYRRATSERDDLEAALTSLRQRRSEIQLELDRATNSTVYHREQIDLTREALKTDAVECHALQVSLEESEQEWTQLTMERSRLENESQTIEEAEKNGREEVLTVGRQVDDAEERLEGLRNRLVQVSAEAATIKNEKGQLHDRLNAFGIDQERLTAERSLAVEELAQVTSILKKKEALLKGQQEELEDIRTAVRELELRKKAFESDSGELNDQVAHVNNRLAGLSERLQSLEEVEMNRSHYSEGVQGILKHLSKSKSVATAGTFADSIQTSPQYEHLVEEFLDEELEYILVDSFDEAIRGLSELRTLESGKCTFFSLGSNGFGTKPSGANGNGFPRKSDGVYGRLDEVLTMKPEVKQAFQRAMPHRAEAVVVSDMDRALNLAHSYPENTFITLAGEALSPMGLLSGTASGSTKIGLLGFRRQKRELEKKVVAQKQDLALLERKQETKKKELEKACYELEHKQSFLYQLDKETIGLSHECDQCRREIERRTRVVEVVDTEIEELVREQKRLKDRLLDIDQSVSQNSADQRGVHEELREARVQLQDLRVRQDEFQDRLNAISADRKVLNERRLALEQTFRRVDEHKTQTKTRLSHLRLRQTQGESRIDELKASLEQLQLDTARLEVETEEIEAKLNAKQEQLEAWKELFRGIETGLEKLRSEREMVHEHRSKIEVDLARAETQLQNLEDHCKEQLSTSLEEVSRNIDVSKVDSDAICDQYEELKQQLEKFGPINMAALSEYQENEKRHSFLTKQIEDIEISIADTTKTIQEVNRRSKAQFSETFKAINTNFNRVFQKLFGGGHCGMELLDEEDILECGIDIFAQPPGKKLQNVMLLSGGEKALTVFSLLVAMFMYRPSRFCILDEVDAPLDDSNVQRFGELIEEMSHDTQFIIVTHNKATMEISDTLYGITMEEAGISKMVSVRF